MRCKKKKTKRMLCLVLVIILICSFSPQALALEGQSSLVQQTISDEEILEYLYTTGRNEFALEEDPIFIIPNKYYNSEEEVGVLPGVTTNMFIQPESEIAPKTFGEGYVIGRARTWMTASDGYIRTGYKKGTFSSIASIALSFVSGIPAQTVGTILSIVGLVASGPDTVSGETLITYRYIYRDGEGRWSSDPNTSGYWHLGYRTGRRETYKHITGGKLNNTTQIWTFETVNYNTTPAKTETSFNYSQSDSWLAEQGRQYVTVGSVYSEVSW